MPAVIKTMSEPSRSQFVGRLFGRLLAYLGVTPSTQPAGALVTHTDAALGLAVHQRLSVGVYGDKLDPLDSLFDHAVDSIAAAAADPNHADFGYAFLLYCTLRQHHEPPFYLLSTVWK
jgi:hypothetical protein